MSEESKIKKIAHEIIKASVKLVGKDDWIDDNDNNPLVVRPVGENLSLQREHENTFDSNAIAVFTGRHQCGYIAKKVAAKLSPYIDSSSVTGAQIDLDETADIRQGRSFSWLFLHLEIGPDVGVAEVNDLRTLGPIQLSDPSSIIDSLMSVPPSSVHDDEKHGE